MDRLEKAMKLVKKAFEGQYRVSGDNADSHSIGVYELLKEYTSDKNTLIAGLLHDIVEDTEYNLNYIEQRFGKDVAYLVDLVTFKTNNLEEDLNYSCQDERAILIKKCDRLQNSIATYKNTNNDFIIRFVWKSLKYYMPIIFKDDDTLKEKTIKRTEELISFINTDREIDEYHTNALEEIKNIKEMI